MMTLEEYKRRHLAGERWIVEFGEAFEPPAEILALVHAGEMKDLSWGNDACPRFGVVLSPTETEIVVWTAPDVKAHPEYEEDFGNEGRYMVDVRDEMGDSVTSSYTNDVHEAIARWRVALIERSSPDGCAR